MKQKRRLEFEVKIGLFVLIAIVLLTIITFSIGDFFWRSGYSINVVLGFANGVQESAPVRLAGIHVGELKEASVFKDEAGRTQTRLKLWLSEEAKVEEDATISINTLGLIGEKYVEILPGTPGSVLLQDGDTIEGDDSVSMEQLTRKGYDVAIKIERLIESLDEILIHIKEGKGTVGRLLYEEGLYNEIDAMVKDLKAHPWKLLHRPRKEKSKTKD